MCFNEKFMKQKLQAPLIMDGWVRSDQEPDHTQVSGGRSNCMKGFCSHGPLPIKVEICQEDGVPPERTMPMFGLGTPTPGVRGH